MKCLRLILSFLGMGCPSAFQWSWGLGFPTAMQGNWTSVFATATKESSKLAILAGIRVVGDKVAFCDGAPSPIVVWAVTQNSYLKCKKINYFLLKYLPRFLHNFCVSNLSLFFRWQQIQFGWKSAQKINDKSLKQKLCCFDYGWTLILSTVRP